MKKVPACPCELASRLQDIQMRRDERLLDRRYPSFPRPVAALVDSARATLGLLTAREEGMLARKGAQEQVERDVYGGISLLKRALIAEARRVA